MIFLFHQTDPLPRLQLASDHLRSLGKKLCRMEGVGEHTQWGTPVDPIGQFQVYVVADLRQNSTPTLVVPSSVYFTGKRATCRHRWN